MKVINVTWPNQLSTNIVDKCTYLQQSVSISRLQYNVVVLRIAKPNTNVVPVYMHGWDEFITITSQFGKTTALAVKNE